MRRLVLLGGVVLTTAIVTSGLTGASAPRQVEQGTRSYQQQCIACHGANLQGGTMGAKPLVGADFAQRWRSVSALRAFIQRSMPLGAGGTLTQEEALNLAQYLLSQNGVQPDGFAEPAFRERWAAADEPVAAGQVRRSWLWGPEGFAVVWEPYAEAPGGTRLVQYFDKTRMEITNLDSPRDQPAFVTNGLLAKELVTGLVQTGNARSTLSRPAAVNVAGDSDDPTGPTYATFSKLTGRVEERRAAVVETIDRAGNVGQNEALGAYAAYAAFIPETGHNIPSVFMDYFNQQSPVFNWVEAVGFPITEAYWARVKVNGAVKDVLVQAFERRVLTYTPDNQAGFQVEMGNVGRHYYAWRYPQQ